MEELLNFVSNNGFAIVVAVYLLVKGSKDTSNMTNTIGELKNVVTELTAVIRSQGKGGSGQ